MMATLTAERRKLTSIRSPWLLAGAVLLYPLISLIGAIRASGDDLSTAGPEIAFDLVRGGADVAAFAALVLGILAVSGEYRYGTIVPSLLTTPRRSHFVAAKLAVQTAAGAALAGGAMVVSVTVGGLYLSSVGVPVFDIPATQMLTAVAGVVGVGALFGAIGAGLGAIVRNQTAAIAGALVWLLAIEGALPVVLRNPELREWMLTGASGRLFRLADAGPELGSATEAAVLLVVVAIVVGAIAAIVTTVADVEG